MAQFEAQAPSQNKQESKESKVEESRSKDRHRNRSKSRERHRNRRDRSSSRDRRRDRRRSHSRTRRERRRSRSRSRRRSKDRDRSSRNTDRKSKIDRSSPELDDDPVPGKIYNGKVANIVPFGCFVQIEGLRRRWEGLVHISQLRAEGRVTNVSEVVNRGSKVKVKVLSVTGQKVSLSMKDVCQMTGKDLNPLSHAPVEREDKDRNPDRPTNSTSVLRLPVGVDENEEDSRKRVTRISSPERWEIKQVKYIISSLESLINVNICLFCR